MRCERTCQAEEGLLDDEVNEPDDLFAQSGFRKNKEEGREETSSRPAGQQASQQASQPSIQAGTQTGRQAARETGSHLADQTASQLEDWQPRWPTNSLASQENMPVMPLRPQDSVPTV